jgi:hypothetical protein
MILGAHADGVFIVVKVTGTIGGYAVRGTLDVGAKGLAFSGTAGTTRVTMSASINPVGANGTVLVKIG